MTRPALAVSTLLALLVAAGAAVPAVGQANLKIGVFDKQRIVDESQLGVSARQKFERQQQEAEAEVAAKQKAFEALQQSYQQKAQALSEEKRVELNRQVAKARDEFQAAASNADRDLQRAYQQALIDIVNKMEPVVVDFARTNGYDLLFDQTQVSFGSKGLDVTDQIIAKLNAQTP